jgi:hypothetical protein
MTIEDRMNRQTFTFRGKLREDMTRQDLLDMVDHLIAMDMKQLDLLGEFRRQHLSDICFMDKEDVHLVVGKTPTLDKLISTLDDA